jgi:hypothetical protein
MSGFDEEVEILTSNLIDVGGYKVVSAEVLSGKRRPSTPGPDESNKRRSPDSLSTLVELLSSEVVQEKLSANPDVKQQLIKLLAPQISVLLLLDCTGEQAMPFVHISETKMTPEQISALHNSVPTSREKSNIPGFNAEDEEFDENVWKPVRVKGDSELPKITHNNVNLIVAWFND